MTTRKLGLGLDFDLAVKSEEGEELTDDAEILQRGRMVLLERKAPKGKQGTAQRYVGGSYVPTGGFGSRVASLPFANQSQAFGQGRPVAPSVVEQPIETLEDIDQQDGALGEKSETEKIAQMLLQSNEYWNAQSSKMASIRPVLRPFRPPPSKIQNEGRFNAPEDNGFQRPVPAGYICYRCGQRGHYITNCPTLGDAEWDNKPRLKRTTGIPRMFLQTVTQPGKDGKGAMVTEEGAFVVMKSNDDAWSALNKKRGVQEDVPKELECRLCKGLLRDPTSVKCCKDVYYCDECIRHALLENEDATLRFKCPNCFKDAFPDDLRREDDIKKKVVEFLKESMEGKSKKVKLERELYDDDVDYVLLEEDAPKSKLRPIYEGFVVGK